MKTWLENQPDAVAKVIEQGFVTLEAYDQVRVFSNAETVPVSYADIYSMATGTPHRPTSEIQQALLRQPNLRRDFQAMLKTMAKAYAPRVAAASSRDIVERTGDNFTVTLKPSKADEKQCYVQLKLGPKAEKPRFLVISHPHKEGFILQSLPEIRENLYQWLEMTGSDIVRAIQNRETELYLC